MATKLKALNQGVQIDNCYFDLPEKSCSEQLTSIWLITLWLNVCRRSNLFNWKKQMKISRLLLVYLLWPSFTVLDAQLNTCSLKSKNANESKHILRFHPYCEVVDIFRPDTSRHVRLLYYHPTSFLVSSISSAILYDWPLSGNYTTKIKHVRCEIGLCRSISSFLL